MKKLLFARLMFCAVGMAASAAYAQADNYPSQPVRFIVPLGPGSAADTNTRGLADRFQKLTGQPAFVENKPGADLILGTTSALNAPADGHSILLITPGIMLINPLLMKDLPYKPEQIKPVLHLSSSAAVLVVGPGSKFNTLAEILESARKAPGAVSMGQYGSSHRLGLQVLGQAAGVQFIDIPYKGFSATVNDVIGGTVDAALVDLGGALPLIQSGKLKAIAVTSDERVPVVPDVPTVKESGFPDYNLYIFVGYGVKADTPEPVVKKLEALLQQVVQQADFQDTVKQQAGLIFVGQPGQPFEKMIASEAKRYQAAVGGGSAAAK